MENYFQNLFNKAPVGYFVLTKSGIIKSANDLGCRYLGTPKHELENKPLSSFLSESSRGKLSFHLKSIFLTNEQQSLELILEVSGGKKKIVQLNSIVMNSEGEEICWSTMTDVSDLKKSEKEFAGYKSRLDSLTNNSNELMLILDPELNILEGNAKAISVVEYSLDEMIKLNISDLIVPGDETDLKIFGQFFRTRKSEGECFIRTKSNHNIKMHYTILPRYYNDQHLFLLDITSHDSVSKNLLLTTKELFPKIFNDINYAVLNLDKEGNIIFVNDSMLSILQKSKDEIISKNWYENFHLQKKTDVDFKSFELENNEGKAQLKFETEIINSSGVARLLSFDAIFIKDNNGEFIGTLLLGQDITEMKKAEDELNNHIKELESNNELIEKNASVLSELNAKLVKSKNELKNLSADKDKYFSIIAHDLRSPFASLYGFAEYLYNDFENLSKDELRENFNNIYKSAKNMYNLLDNLLQWSRVQSGKIEFDPAKISLVKKIESVLDLYKVTAEKKKINFEVNVDKQITVFADAAMLETILRNLISNAIKFSERNSKVWINSNIEKDVVKITVEDQGVGIDGELIPKLFELNQNKSTKGTEGEEGTGLGLLLCNEFVEKNKGKIWVESTAGSGSSFNFTLPIAK